jgi:hypothetical protein
VDAVLLRASAIIKSRSKHQMVLRVEQTIPTIVINGGHTIAGRVDYVAAVANSDYESRECFLIIAYCLRLQSAPV